MFRILLERKRKHTDIRFVNGNAKRNEFARRIVGKIQTDVRQIVNYFVVVRFDGTY